MRNESNSGRTFLGHYPPATILREKGLSVSIHVGTRKVSRNMTYDDVASTWTTFLLTYYNITTLYLQKNYLLLLLLLLIITDGELCLCRVKPEETLVEARMRF